MLQTGWQPSTHFFFFFFFFLLPLLPLSSDSAGTNSPYDYCNEYSHCGNLNIRITYPFRLLNSPKYCGYPGYELNCILDEEEQLIINLGGHNYSVHNIVYGDRVLVVSNPDFLEPGCPLSITNTSINLAFFNYTKLDRNLTVYLNCNFTNKSRELLEIPCMENTDWHNKSYYHVGYGPSSFMENLTGRCDLTAAVPVYDKSGNFYDLLKGGFGLTWSSLSDWCKECMIFNGTCNYNDSGLGGTCHYTDSKRSKALIIGLTVAGGLGIIAIICCCFFFLYTMEKKKRRSSSTLLRRIVSFQPFSKSDSELGSSMHAPIFNYDELYEATNGFDDSKELGDGGFGAVYKGKLRDGRVVAVKRLYENNYRRVEQFMNEVKILSLLRHPNLVSLYGCTSRHSRELLLVYEYVPNGTVADHLHGPRALESFMPWKVRLSIAIETADALAYLHSADPQIIHRDIKTCNLLLDNNFHVKVADFGLSRLFPFNATHVSTAPQGTPGYVDPEYHQCFQLTDKSDVYSFGVVLMELISSKPAIDISRHRNEISLANMAIGKIQRQELHEFVDQNLGYQSDYSVNRMINLVAELAFQCLQSDGEMRPSIKDVLEGLTGIEKDGQNNNMFEDVNLTLKEEARLLKSSPPCSPNSVTVGWVSRGTTPNTSG